MCVERESVRKGGGTGVLSRGRLAWWQGDCAVSDVNAAIANECGLDIKGLRQHLAAGE